MPVPLPLRRGHQAAGLLAASQMSALARHLAEIGGLDWYAEQLLVLAGTLATELSPSLAPHLSVMPPTTGPEAS